MRPIRWRALLESWKLTVEIWDQYRMKLASPGRCCHTQGGHHLSQEWQRLLRPVQVTPHVAWQLTRQWSVHRPSIWQPHCLLFMVGTNRLTSSLFSSHFSTISDHSGTVSAGNDLVNSMNSETWTEQFGPAIWILQRRLVLRRSSISQVIGDLIARTWTYQDRSSFCDSNH
jgi:hypothetical protein